MAIPEDCGHLLEVGCGIGYNLNKIAKIKKYKSLTGIDVNNISLGIAGKILRGYNRISLIEKDAHYFNLKKKFDTILCSEVLEHVRFPEKVIERILRHSHKNTKIIISVPNEDTNDKLWKIVRMLGLEKKFKEMDIIKRSDHINEFTLDNFKRLVKGKLRILETGQSLSRNCYIFQCRKI